MQTVREPGNTESAPELAWVAEAAGNRLRAEVDGDEDAAGASAQMLLEAATSAMNAGYSLSEITDAESRGKTAVRDALRPDTLKLVERTGASVRTAQTEHHHAIARAVRLGLSTRQIAVAAGVTHGTVRAITNRLSGESPEHGPRGPGGEGTEHPAGEEGGRGGEWATAEQPHEQAGQGGW
jgi:hypothetical protein